MSPREGAACTKGLRSVSVRRAVGQDATRPPAFHEPGKLEVCDSCELETAVPFYEVARSAWRKNRSDALLLFRLERLAVTTQAYGRDVAGSAIIRRDRVDKPWLGGWRICRRV